MDGGDGWLSGKRDGLGVPSLSSQIRFSGVPESNVGTSTVLN